MSNKRKDVAALPVDGGVFQVVAPVNYTLDDVQTIMNAVGTNVTGSVGFIDQDGEFIVAPRFLALWYALNRAVNKRHYEIAYGPKSTPKQRIKYYNDVAVAAQKLRLKLGEHGAVSDIDREFLGGGFYAQAAIEGGNKATGAELFSDALGGVQKLQRWAESAAERERARDTNYDKPSNQGDRIHNGFMQNLAEIYEAIYADKVNVLVNSKRPVSVNKSKIEKEFRGGGFLFLCACLKALNVKKTDVAIKKWIDDKYVPKIEKL